MPPKKKIKKQAPVKQEEGKRSAVPPEMVSSATTAGSTPNSTCSTTSASTLFEFKFISTQNEWPRENRHFAPHDLSGVFHLPLLVDPQTGDLSIPPGDSHDVKICMNFSLKEDGVKLKLQLSGRLVTVETGYQTGHCLRLGMKLDAEEKTFEPIDWSRLPDNGASFVRGEVRISEIDSMLRNVGGGLWAYGWHPSFFHVTRAFELYTVISEHRPGQPVPAPPSLQSTHQPDWDALAARVGKKKLYMVPDANQQNAITEYKRFLALKLTRQDRKSEAFAPSPAVDEVWHAHLVFPEQYQEDVLAFARQLNVEPFVVPHSPLLMRECKSLYEETREQIQSPELKKIVGKEADMEFWPPLEDTWFGQARSGACG